ncbi:uncharacterized protein Z519_06528 [Cladophialophora bantiana CBS 173.52]|uniref:Uncharacterized protein n=1 Tax=Cladophialophora bantiana (strain ATCC 10958 / CBS 173.52 / CDC B-1940 / NIH 8579) TaxID=1442370 RepID=A0A0D2ERY8_CLAB1|nr:uncharacterized protein Z519_06528 [Cladophialophora bantiana CBS 173.52]KIW92681.1 hypothetical protein Z519_06528 [Cladophialophora bantiana CBS 173.52]
MRELNVIVTGCSSGLGKALAQYTYDAGSIVVATARKPETLSYLPDDPRVLKLRLDVTSKDQVAGIVQVAVDKFGSIDVVVNNAGFGVTGDTEVLPDADARAQLETNFWGAVNVTKAALPILRETNPPGGGKFALEGFTDALAKEMHPDWNIKSTIIELGAVATHFPQNMVLPPRHPAYEDPACGYNAVRAYLTSAENAVQWSDASVRAQVLHELASKKNYITPPLRLALLVGADSWAVVKAELEGIMKGHEVWETVAESTSHAENTRAAEFLLKSVR